MSEHPIAHLEPHAARHRQQRANAAQEQVARNRTAALPAHVLEHLRGHGHRPNQPYGQLVRGHIGGHIYQQDLLTQGLTRASDSRCLKHLNAP